ncbi:ribonuclease P protein subunit [Candidatus Woesearchaeota archaeon]|nr:ribonuclease P protein subunit [Candidatus Woesearchaeota archaeon]
MKKTVKQFLRGPLIGEEIILLQYNGKPVEKKGIINWETKKTFRIKVDGKTKSYLKGGIVFLLCFGKMKIKINGKNFMGDVAERIKKFR